MGHSIIQRFFLRFLKPILIIACFFTKLCFAQDSSKINPFISFPDKLFTSLDKKASSIEGKLDKKTHQYLSRLQQRENKLRKKLCPLFHGSLL